MGVFRLLLAISVLAAHAGPVFGTTLVPGNYAVEAFFMISGFYMALVLDGKYTGAGALWKFYSNRYLRLYPLYLLVVLATWSWFMFIWLWSGELPANSWVENYQQMNWLPKLGLIAANWSLVGLDVPSLFHYSPSSGFVLFHYYGAVNSPDGLKWAGEFRTVGQAWSIGLEIWFYLLAPWIVRLPARTLIFVALSSSALKAWMEVNGMLTYFFFPAQLCFFVAGMCAQRLWKRYQRSIQSAPQFGMWCVAGTSVFTTLFPFIHLPGLRWLYYLFCFTALPLIFERTRAMSWDRTFGNLSYPVYLLHMLVLSVWTTVFKNWPPAAPVLVLTLGISWVLLKCLEEPVDAWRQKRI